MTDMKRGLLKTLQLINVVVMVILMLVFRKWDVVVYLVGGVCIVLSIVLCYFLRCPHCGRWPRKGDFWNEFCPGCGYRLSDE